MEIPFENHNTELKETLNDSLLKEIVSFLNSFDGKIYIGISKDRKVVGVSDNNDKTALDDMLIKLSDIVTDQISPRCVDFVNIKHIVLNNKDVIEIEVLKGKEFYYIKKYGMSERGCFIREGTTAKPLTSEEIKRRYIATLLIPEPTITKMRADRQKLTFDVFKIYLGERKIKYVESSFAETFNLLTPNGEYNEMAWLLSDQFDFSIKVARFKGDGGDLVMRKEFGNGCLFKIYYEVKSYMQSQINNPRTYFDHGQRRDEYLYDEEAFVEAWKNAILHNNYAEKHYPAIYLYDDHLEVFSNGNPLKNVSLEEFLRGKSVPINDDLMRLAIKLRITDQTGKGNRDIVRVYGKKVFEISKNLLSVNIPYNPLAMEEKESTPATQKTTQKTTQKSTQEQIVELVEENPFITRKMLASLLNITEDGIKYHLAALKKKEIIKRIGGDKGGYWKIIQKK